jgi:hypothetical protein
VNWLAAVLSAGLLTACTSGAGPSSPQPSAGAPTQSSSPAAVTAPAVTPTSATAVIARANEVLAALKAKDGAKLAALADPVNGVRFSPYPYVRIDKDVVLSVAEIARGFADPQVRLWGTTSGRGDPIRMTFTDYVAAYVYDRDYLASAQISVDHVNGNGSSIDNTTTVYPAATLVEFYQPSSTPNGVIDWRALRLLLEQRSGTWYLVAVVHGEWTI